MVIQQKSGKYLHVLLSNCLVPGCCTFFRLRNLIPKHFSVHQSSPPLYVFPVPFFYAPPRDNPLMRLPLFFSFFPYIHISLSNSICSRESTFLSSISLPFFKNQNAHLLSCRIFSFHMYAATLIPFSSQNISLTFLSAHILVRVEQQPLFSCQTIKNENRENKNKKSQQSYNLSKIKIK